MKKLKDFHLVVPTYTLLNLKRSSHVNGLRVVMSFVLIFRKSANQHRKRLYINNKAI